MRSSTPTTSRCRRTSTAGPRASWAARRRSRRTSSRRASSVCPRERTAMKYDLPDVITVEADGPLRIVRLNRPEQLNAINDELPLGLTELFPQRTSDTEARVAVITGNGRAFSAGGDFDLLDRMANDRALRR